MLGRFVDSTDGNTAETALTIANTDIKLWVEGATTLANKNSGGATHIATGLYSAVLDATDTATLGKLEIHVHVSGALAVKREYMVLPAMVYDSLVLGTDVLQADAIQWLGTAAATPTTAGVPEVDITHWIGTAVAAVDTAGYPKVTIKSGTGTGELSLSSGGVATRGNVKKAAALAKFPFLMTDSTNHSPATGKTVTATISKDGGAFGSLNSGDSVTEIGVGIYEVDLDATDTNANCIILRFTATGCDDTFERIITTL